MKIKIDIQFAGYALMIIKIKHSPIHRIAYDITIFPLQVAQKKGVVGGYNQQHHGGGHQGRPSGNSGGGQGNKKMPLNV